LGKLRPFCRVGQMGAGSVRNNHCLRVLGELKAPKRAPGIMRKNRSGEGRGISHGAGGIWNAEGGNEIVLVRWNATAEKHG